jgi:carboxymethylenebutenolidase
MVLHFGGKDDHIPPAAVEKIRAAFAGRDDVEVYVYPDAGHAFYLLGRASYSKPAAQMAHSPTIALLRRTLGPRYDLNGLWDRHCEYEFSTRNADATMTTMVAQPYVNHIPTMTGGVGFEQLHRFYKNHFIPKLPKDTRLVSVSRTIGADRIVDELLFCFTHDMEIDWLLPGIPPTGKYVEVPTVAIVCFRGDKLYHEHIYWDQASVLVQIGLLDPQGLPVAGIETAKKLVDETLPSNTLMKRWVESGPAGEALAGAVLDPTLPDRPQTIRTGESVTAPVGADWMNEGSAGHAVDSPHDLPPMTTAPRRPPRRDDSMFMIYFWVAFVPYAVFMTIIAAILYFKK